MKQGSYTMNINQAKKELQIVIVGNFTPEQAQQFVADYNKKVNSIPASEFTLRLDCTDLGVVTPELIPSLEYCYDMYKQSGFKKIIFEIANSTIVKMQLNRIARKVGLANAEFVEVQK